jgi:hypothetical protein
LFLIGVEVFKRDLMEPNARLKRYQASRPRP